MTSTVHYELLTFDKATETFDEESQQKLLDLLTILHDGHIIWICHPNHLFSAEPLKNGKTKIDSIDWEDVRFGKMIRKNDYGRFSICDLVFLGFRYLHSRMSHDILTKTQRSLDIHSTLTVLETNTHDGAYPQVRGIVFGDKTGYSIAFNPSFHPPSQLSIWDKAQIFASN